MHRFSSDNATETADLNKRQQARAAALIDGTRGRTFGATFIKKDGSVRDGTFRIGYNWTRTTSNPKLSRSYSREMHGLIKAVDMLVARKRGKKAAIRSIPLALLRSLRIDGRAVDCTTL